MELVENAYVAEWIWAPGLNLQSVFRISEAFKLWDEKVSYYSHKKQITSIQKLLSGLR